MMKNYRRLMNSEDVPVQLKKYISVIDTIKAKSGKKGALLEKIIPDILWISDGCQKNVMDMICNYLSEEQLLEFVGENKNITIKLEQPTESKPLSNMCGKFNDMMFLAAGFRGRFQGVICIDIQDIKHFNHDFQELMKHIKANSEGCLRIIVGKIKEYQVKSAEQALAAAGYRIHTVRSDVLSVEKALILIKIKLEDCGFSLETDAKRSMEIMLQKLIEANKVSSLHEVNNLCDDILFFLLSNNSSGGVTEKLVNEYFRQCILCYKKNKESVRIGFVSAKEEHRDDI